MAQPRFADDAHTAQLQSTHIAPSTVKFLLRAKLPPDRRFCGTWQVFSPVLVDGGAGYCDRRHAARLTLHQIDENRRRPVLDHSLHDSVLTTVHGIFP